MHNLPDWFPEVWKDEVDVLPQQMKTKVADTIDDGGYFEGDTCYMPRIGPIETVKASRLAELTRQTAPLTWIKVDCEPEFLPIVIWDPDKKKLNIPVTKSLAGEVVKGVIRARDRLVIEAFHDAVTNGVQPVRGKAREAQAGNPPLETVQTIGDYDTVIDLDLLAHAYALLGEDEVDVEGEQITFLSDFRNKINLSLDPLVTSASTNKRDLPWTDFNWRSSQLLKGNGAGGGIGTGVDCYLYAKSCATTAWNDGVTEINERLGHILADMFGQWFQAGAVVKQPKKIIRIKGKANFQVTRKAIPVDNVGN